VKVAFPLAIPAIGWIPARDGRNPSFQVSRPSIMTSSAGHPLSERPFRIRVIRLRPPAISQNPVPGHNPVRVVPRTLAVYKPRICLLPTRVSNAAERPKSEPRLNPARQNWRVLAESAVAGSNACQSPCRRPSWRIEDKVSGQPVGCKLHSRMRSPK